MDHGCDVCRNFRPEANLRKRPLTAVTFDEQRVVLCDMHRQIAERSSVTTFEALRELYGESEGNRSYVPRRLTADEPAVLEDRRRVGRRATDAL